MKQKELTAIIIGCAMAVHRYFKNGFPEIIYQRSLAIELETAGISFVREHEIPIYYRSQKVGSRKVDFWIENMISLEIKAASELEGSHFAQAFNYLEVCNIEFGLLINFGENSLKFHRLTNKKFRNTSSSN